MSFFFIRGFFRSNRSRQLLAPEPFPLGKSLDGETIDLPHRDIEIEIEKSTY